MRVRLAWAEVQARLGQLSMAVAMIAVGVALSAGVLMANTALLESFEDALGAVSGRASLQVTAVSGSPFPERYLEIVRATDGVDAAAGLLAGMVHVDLPGDEIARIVGVDMLDEASIDVFQAAEDATRVQDPLIFMNQTDSVIVPARFAARHGLTENDGFTVEAPTGTKRLTIRGLLDDADSARAFGGGFGVMDLFAAQKVLDAQGQLTQIDVLAEDPEVTRGELREALPRHLNVMAVSERKADEARAIQGFQFMLDVISVMGLLLAALITSNRLGMIYQSRLWEIGVLRALGRPPRYVLTSLLLEAAILSGIGVAIGLPLGWLLSQAIAGPIAQTMLMNFKEVVAISTISPTWSALLVAGGAGVLSGVAAALVPGARAVRMPVVDVLASARQRDPWRPSGLRRIATLTLPALAFLLVLLQVLTGVRLFSGLAMVLSLIGGVCLVQPGLRALSPVLAKLVGDRLAIGVKDQSRFPSRAVGATVVLMAGLSVVVLFASMGDSFEEYVAGRDAMSRKGDLIVESSYDVGPGKPPIEGSIVDEIARIPGVARVSAEVGTITRAGSAEHEIGVFAIDDERFLDRRFADWDLEEAEPDALERVARGEGMLANRQLLQTLDKGLGDTATVMSPTGSLELPILGITTISFLSQSGDVTMSRALYRRAWEDDSILRASVLVEEGAEASEVSAAILETLGSRYRLQVISHQELREFVAANVAEGLSFFTTLAALTLLVVAIGTADALAADVVERTREIGTLRTLGISPRDIGVMLLMQALAIGVVGGVLGLLVGAGLSLSFVEGLLPDILGWQLQLRFNGSLALGVSVAGILACLVGAILPAIRGGALPPAQALRYE